MRTVQIKVDIPVKKLRLYLEKVLGEEKNKEIKQLILELITNIKEHALSDLIVEVVVLDAIDNRTDELVQYITVGLISYSKQQLYSKIEDFYLKVDEQMHVGTLLETEYSLLNEINARHQLLTNDESNEYEYEHMRMLQSFQDGVTGREESFGNDSGTGLANTIKIISMRTSDEVGLSYVYSGNHICYFRTDSLIFDNKICTFNTIGDYKQLPEENIYEKSSVFFPGTAFHLIFPIEKG